MQSNRSATCVLIGGSFFYKEIIRDMLLKYLYDLCLLVMS